ncbi:MAG: response regulator [Nitrospirae bacterium]|nr:response regulator [Nitrospirota bacterium]
MRHWPIRKKLTAIGAATAGACAVFLGTLALLAVDRAADARLAAARAQLDAILAAEQRPLIDTARRMARRAEIGRIPGGTAQNPALALSATFTGAMGRAVDADTDLIAVTGADGTLAFSLVRQTVDSAALPPVQRALGGGADAGLALVNGGAVLVAAAPLYAPEGNPGAPAGAVVVGLRVQPAALAEWGARAGATLRLDHVMEAPPLPWLPATRAAGRDDGGPVVHLALAGGWRDVLPGAAPWLFAGAVLALLLAAWAARVAGSVSASLAALEHHVTEAAAGRPVPPLPVTGQGELARVAATVNHLAGLLAHRDRERVQSGKRLATLLEQMVDAVFLFDRTGRIREANVTAQRLTGLDRDGLLARDLIALLPDDETAREDAYRRFHDCLNGHSQVFETRVRAAGGRVVPVEVSAGLLTGLEAPMVQAVVRDVSQRKRLEAQLAEAEKMEGIGTLAGGIAHDFNNILGGILGYAALLKGTLAGDERLFHYADIIERSATRAAELTQQLLGYARGGKYQVKRIDANRVIDEVATLMRESLGARGISIDQRLAADLPAIEADASQLHQVLTNLCVNARDAMPHGGRLRLLSEGVDIAPGQEGAPPGLAPGRYVRVTVADTGHGMSPEVQKRIFEPFYTTKPPGAGSGLGLAMVYGIVKNHGGQITVASRPGQGTAMRLYLPALTGPARIEKGAVHTPAADAPVVMVVDDETTLLELARDILSAQGYGVLLARDGEEALALYDEYGGRIDLVVLDIVMPRMGGKETFRALRERNPALRVVVSSGFSRHGQAQDLLEAGADAFVQKPYRPEELTRVVRETLRPVDAGAPPQAGS